MNNHFFGCRKFGENRFGVIDRTNISFINSRHYPDHLPVHLPSHYKVLPLFQDYGEIVEKVQNKKRNQ